MKKKKTAPRCFAAKNFPEKELLLAAAGKTRLPRVKLDLKKLDKIPTGKVGGNKAVRAVLADRDEGW